MNKNIVVTGSSGFVGHYLISRLANSGDNIYGLDYRHRNIEGCSYNYQNIDLLNSSKVNEIVSNIQPDEVYHLAGFSSPSISWDNYYDCLMVNQIGTYNLLNAIKENKNQNCKILIISSAEVYGNKVEEVNYDERSPNMPKNPYSLSKVLVEEVASFFYNNFNMNIVILRPSNHIGAGQSLGFVTSDFASQIAKIEIDLLDKMTVGDLRSTKSFLHVKDIVEAYVLAMKHCISGEKYNISGSTYLSIKEILDYFCSLSSKKINFVQNKKYPSTLVGVNKILCEKFVSLTNWKPSIDMYKSFEEILIYWRTKVREETSK